MKNIYNIVFFIVKRIFINRFKILFRKLIFTLDEKKDGPKPVI